MISALYPLKFGQKEALCLSLWKQISNASIWILTASEYLILKYLTLKTMYLNLFVLNSPLWNYKMIGQFVKFRPKNSNSNIWATEDRTANQGWMLLNQLLAYQSTVSQSCDPGKWLENWNPNHQLETFFF